MGMNFVKFVHVLWLKTKKFMNILHQTFSLLRYFHGFQVPSKMGSNDSTNQVGFLSHDECGQHALRPTYWLHHDPPTNPYPTW